MGLRTDNDRSLWKDRALTELNLAVLHSFSSAGVTITDHHTESVRFLKHLELEERQGRACPADWTWIVPPAASSATAGVPPLLRGLRSVTRTSTGARTRRAARPS